MQPYFMILIAERLKIPTVSISSDWKALDGGEGEGRGRSAVFAVLLILQKIFRQRYWAT